MNRTERLQRVAEKFAGCRWQMRSRVEELSDALVLPASATRGEMIALVHVQIGPPNEIGPSDFEELVDLAMQRVAQRTTLAPLANRRRLVRAVPRDCEPRTKTETVIEIQSAPDNYRRQHFTMYWHGYNSPTGDYRTRAQCFHAEVAEHATPEMRVVDRTT